MNGLLVFKLAKELPRGVPFFGVLGYQAYDDLSHILVDEAYPLKKFKRQRSFGLFELLNTLESLHVRIESAVELKDQYTQRVHVRFGIVLGLILLLRSQVHKRSATLGHINILVVFYVF